MSRDDILGSITAIVKWQLFIGAIVVERFGRSASPFGNRQSRNLPGAAAADVSFASVDLEFWAELSVLLTVLLTAPLIARHCAEFHDISKEIPHPESHANCMGAPTARSGVGILYSSG